MESIKSINSNQTIGINISPTECDIAIVPIDSEGNPNEVNKYVLTQYGYSIDVLPRKRDLLASFSQIPTTDKKAILFVVIPRRRVNAERIIEENLYSTLTEFRGWITLRKVWLPLLGTESDILSYETSYSIINRVILRFEEEFNTRTQFLISFPEDNQGVIFFNNLNGKTSSENKEVENIVKGFKNKFFLVGSVWEGDDQIKRFISESIWEKGYGDETYARVINKVNKGDILILKSTYSNKKNISYLRIKAFGLVTENINDGSKLSVNWIITDLSIDIEHLGYYRNTIVEVTVSDAVSILSKLSKNLLKKLFPLYFSFDKGNIAGLLSDTDDGDDYLDIKKDIDAFSKVMASKSFRPPLAIALFGKWGSGKSFFMNKLKERINFLSLTDTNSTYSKGIAHIHFNAWSYLDANLWASIVSKIFEGLNEYITNDSEAKKFKKEIEKELTRNLTVVKDQIDSLENQKNELDNQISKLKDEKEELCKKFEDDVNSIQNKTLNEVVENVNKQFDVSGKISEALQSNATYIQTEDQLKLIIPEKYWSNPVSAYNKIQSKYTFLKEFFRRDKVNNNLIWLVSILLLILIVPPVLCILYFSLSSTIFVIPQVGLSLLITIGAIWKRAEVVYSKLQPIVASFWNIKEDYEQALKAAIFKFEQEEKALKLKIEQHKIEIDAVNQLIQQAEVSKSNIEYKINNTLSSEAMYTFIDKRIKSDDYSKHLGIVSIIRRDFEILSSLFLDHNKEISEIDIRDKFTTPLERIILYIDDLDRCTEERVVEVLEAVNLLMAFPLFIVVVGVDPRWVKNALIKKYQLQFAGHIKDLNSGKELEVIDASNYLEKIFQVPFHLKEASDLSVKNMLKSLCEVNKQSIYIKDDNVVDSESVELSGGRYIGEMADFDLDLSKAKKNSYGKIDQVDVLKPKHLVLSDEEVQLIQDLSVLIGNNPRAIKRFVNIYQIVRVHEELIDSDVSDTRDFLVIMFLLALSIGPYKKLSNDFNNYIYQPLNFPKLLNFYLLLSNVDDDPEKVKLKAQLSVDMNGKDTFNILLNENIESFNKYIKFIRRFTFSDCV